MIDAAIVGLGRWGRNFVESIQGKSTRMRFVRAVDPAVENARAFAAAHGLPVDAEFDAVLRDRSVQAVVLATPHSAHLPQVIAAAATGKQVFCEKPLALTLADARLIVDACRNASVVLGIGANRRLWPSMQSLRRLVEAGELGELLHLEGNHSNENSNQVARRPCRIARRRHDGSRPAYSRHIRAACGTAQARSRAASIAQTRARAARYGLGGARV